jgi:hypothetical protein
VREALHIVSGRDKDKLFFRNEIIMKIQTFLMELGISSHFLECSSMECSEEEKKLPYPMKSILYKK